MRSFIVQDREEAGVRVIAVTGELDIATAPQLCVELDAVRSARRPRVLIDLTGVTFCDSTGLRALMGAAREVRAHGGQFAIVCPPSGGVARLLEIVGAFEWMVVHPDGRSGLAALVSRLPPAA